MIKTIKIGESEYVLNSNAYTRFLYKKEFNRGIFEDVQVITNFALEVQEEKDRLDKENLSEEEKSAKIGVFALEKLDNFIDVLLQLAYIFIKCNDENFMAYEDWLKTIDTINPNDTWVSEVTELAVSSFRR